MALHLSSVRRYVPQHGGNRDLLDDQQISLDIKMPTVRDMLEIQKMIRSAGGAMSPEVDIDSLDPEQTMRLWDVMSAIVIKQTDNWKNVTLDGNAATTPTDVLRALGMADVVMISEITQEIMASGKGSVNEAKNSDSESGRENSDSDSIVLHASLPASSESVTAVAVS